MGQPRYPTIDPDPEVIEEIGRIVVAWGRLEYVLKLGVKSCLDQGFSAGMLYAEELRQNELATEFRALLAQRPWPPAALGIWKPRWAG